MFCLTAAKANSKKANDPVEDILRMDQKDEQQLECVRNENQMQQLRDNVDAQVSKPEEYEPQVPNEEESEIE